MKTIEIVNFKSLDSYELKRYGTVYIVKNDKKRDNNNLLGSEVFIDDIKCLVLGIDTIPMATIEKGEEIGLLVEKKLTKIKGKKESKVDHLIRLTLKGYKEGNFDLDYCMDKMRYACANSRRYNGSNFQLGYFCGLLFAWIILLLIK